MAVQREPGASHVRTEACHAGARGIIKRIDRHAPRAGTSDDAAPVFIPTHRKGPHMSSIQRVIQVAAIGTVLALASTAVMAKGSGTPQTHHCKLADGSTDAGKTHKQCTAAKGTWAKDAAAPAAPAKPAAPAVPAAPAAPVKN